MKLDYFGLYDVENTVIMETVKDRFLRYVSFDTQSDSKSCSHPSTAGQLVLMNLLCDELKSLGVSNATIDEHGYLTATIPSNIGKDVPAVGFIAHVDTSPDTSGANVKPRTIPNYDGKDIVLNSEKNIVMTVADFPELAAYRGETLITTDGTTLLGADDKAGIAEIMQAVQYICTDPDFKHGEVKIGFTVDEEIGRGTDKFDVEKFGADYAYTVDGGAVGELEFENFNAASAKISVAGKNIHPGYAKNKMINATLVAMEFNAMLPPEQRPEHTDGYEGFYHLTGLTGTVENAEMHYIVRDHDGDVFRQRLEFLQSCVNLLNRRYGKDVLTISLTEQYRNMKQQIEPHFHIVDLACRAMKKAGVEPLIRPVRGGTDGARLSFLGLPCPNIFTGGHNFHGKYEFISVRSMEKACKVILNLIELYSE